MKQPRIFVLSAPSGAGKSTLIKRVMPKIDNLLFSISATTRKPRKGEVDGREYFFKTREDFEDMIRLGELAEWQEVFGNYYGTPKFFINNCLEQGNSVILDIDVYGKSKLDAVYPDNVGIFISAPSVDVLRSRLSERKTESAEDLAKRISKAEEETKYAFEKGNYKYTVVNDVLEIAEKELVDIIVKEQEIPDGN